MRKIVISSLALSKRILSLLSFYLIKKSIMSWLKILNKEVWCVVHADPKTNNLERTKRTSRRESFTIAISLTKLYQQQWEQLLSCSYPMMNRSYSTGYLSKIIRRCWRRYDSHQDQAHLSELQNYSQKIFIAYDSTFLDYLCKSKIHSYF